MELVEILEIWKAYDVKLEKALKLNQRCLEMIQAQKVKSKLRPLLWQRVIEISVHVIVIFWLIIFFSNNLFHWQHAVSAIVLIAFFLICFVNGVKQIITIKQLDYSDNVVTIQSSLVMLQTHIADYVRLTFLCMPTYLAYPIIAFKAFANFDIVSKLSVNWWTAQLFFTIAITPFCIWLYGQVSYKNIHKKWVRFVIKKATNMSVAKALKFTQELNEFKK